MHKIETAKAVQVPYFDLKRQNKILRSDLEAVFLNVLDSGQFVLGAGVENFEHAFAQYCGTRRAVGVGCGTDALIFSLRAAGIKEGDEVVIPSFTFTATAFAVMHLKARPVFADVNPLTYNLDPEAARKTATSRTRAVIPVHLFGQVADMNPLMDWAKKRKLKVIEDACQAHGASLAGKKAGSFGDAGCFSFYPTKNLAAFGDGGMVTTSDPSIAEAVQRARNLGRKFLGDTHAELGWVSRLDALQAAILSTKLKYLDSLNQKRRRVAALYRERLSSTPLILPGETKDAFHVYHLFVVRVPNLKREALRKFLNEQGIPTMTHYAIPVHRQPACRSFAKKDDRLPITEQLAQETLALPLFPEITDEEVDLVSRTIRQFFGK